MPAAVFRYHTVVIATATATAVHTICAIKNSFGKYRRTKSETENLFLAITCNLKSLRKNITSKQIELESPGR